MKKFIKLLSFIFAVIIVSSVFTAVPNAAVTNDEIKAKQNEISGLQDLLKDQAAASKAARDRINEIKNDIEQTEEKKEELIEKIGTLNADILTTEKLITTYGEYIELKEEEIKGTEEDLNSQEASLVEFLRYEYESGSSALKTIEFLLDSASLSDFLSNIQYIGTLMDYQDHLIQDLENTSTKYEGQKYDLSEAKKEQEEYAVSLKDQLAESEKLKKEAMEYIVKLEADQLDYEAVLQSSEEAEKELTERIEKALAEEAKLIKEEEEREAERKRKEEEERRKREAEEAARKAAERANSSSKKDDAERARQAEANAAAYGDGYMWPLPVNKWFIVSGWFGYEPDPIGSGIRFHKAIDLAANRGTDIFSAAAGKVITAKYSSSYGNHVVILHSNGYSTLYAHASKLLVKEGDKVSQGQVIALVGTTGYSTGNHLHFEIIQPNGKTREDPMLYFPKMYELHKNDSNRYDYLNNPRKKVYTP
jgi:murein DD-endopeptidase MepM/ murein hydrolase activator NlpD